MSGKRKLDDDSASGTSSMPPPSTKPKNKAKRKQQDVYEVDKIVDHRYNKERERMEYLVQWEGYDASGNSWEGMDNLDNCRAVVEEYRKEKNVADPLQSMATINPVPPATSTPTASASITNHVTRQRPLGNQIVDLLNSNLSSYEFQIKRTGENKFDLNCKRKPSTTTMAGASAAAASSPAPSNASSTDIEIRGGPSTVVINQREQLDKWLNEINRLCIAANEAPLQIENNVDGEIISTNDFKYVTSLIAGTNVDLTPALVMGCNCALKGGSCSSRRKICCPDGMGVEFAYNKKGKLITNVGRPIYECNSKCPCPPSCINRVVQNGRQITLRIFRTNNGRGWGVMAVTKIEKGTFVSEYCGEVITKTEADVRENEEESDGAYFFTLDYDEDPRDQYVIDAKSSGNVSRFINHSCDPNTGVCAVWVDNLNLKLHRVAFFTTRDIEAGEELTFNYHLSARGQDTLNSSMASNASDDETEIPPRGASTSGGKRTSKVHTECRCGAANCSRPVFATKQ